MALPPRNRVSFSRLRRFAEDVNADLRLARNGPIRRALHQWGELYLGFLKTRFSDFSRGGGDWPPLSPNSIREKVRKSRAALQGKKKRKRLEAFEANLASGTANFPILRDRGIIFRALQPGADGNEFKHVQNGVLVGIGGPARHPSSNQASIAEIAAFHQRGGKWLPQRRIVVGPDQPTFSQMQSVMRRAISLVRRGGT